MRGRPVDIAKCLAVYDFIIEYKQIHDGNSPGAGKIARKFKTTTSHARVICNRLARDGMIRLGDGHCSIEVIGGQWSLAEP